MNRRTVFYFFATMTCCAVNIALGILPILTLTTILVASFVIVEVSLRH